MTAPKIVPPVTNFESISRRDLPNGRKGKHHPLLVQVLSDLDSLQEDRAIKIPLADFPGSIGDIRSAITRAAKKKDICIATSSDESFFYVWKPTAKMESAR